MTEQTSLTSPPGDLPDQCCARCRYVMLPPEGTQMMPACRRFPPQPFIARFMFDQSNQNVIGNTQVTAFPFVIPQGWCGEFKRQASEVQ